jgi:hypothetical protein
VSVLTDIVDVEVLRIDPEPYRDGNGDDWPGKVRVRIIEEGRVMDVPRVGQFADVQVGDRAQIAINLVLPQ